MSFAANGGALKAVANWPTFHDAHGSTKYCILAHFVFFGPRGSCLQKSQALKSTDHNVRKPRLYPGSVG